MALTVSSIVGNVSGHINNDRYLALAAVKLCWPSDDRIKRYWLVTTQDLVNIIETKVSEVAATGYDMTTKLLWGVRMAISVVSKVDDH